MIVALPGLFIYFFEHIICNSVSVKDKTSSENKGKTSDLSLYILTEMTTSTIFL